MNALDLLVKTPEGDFKPKLDKGIVALFVGTSGSGKDCAQWSFTELGDMYVFDVDNRIRGGLASLAWLGKDKVGMVDFDFYNPSDGFEAIDKKFELFLVEAKQRRLKYKTICINSTSSLVFMLAISSRILRGEKSGRSLGKLKFTDPSDYNFFAMAFRTIQFSYIMPLAELGINIIFSGHLVDRWEKPKPDKDLGITEYSPNIRVGVKLLGPDKLAEEIPGYFDEVYEFGRADVGDRAQFTVKFKGDFAKTALPYKGKSTIDVTNKSFYQVWKEAMSGSY